MFKRGRVIETPETLSPKYPLRRRRIASKRYHRAARHQPSLNVNIYSPANPVGRIASPLQHRHCGIFERPIDVTNSKDKKVKCTTKHSVNFIESRERLVASRADDNETNKKAEKRVEERTRRQCPPIEVTLSKPMDYHSK